MAALEFPGRAMFSFGALFFFPAWRQVGVPASLVDEKKKKLPLDMGGDCPPALFIAVDSLERHPQEFC